MVNSALQYIVPGDVWIEVMSFSLLLEFSFEFSQFFRVLCGQVNSLCVVLVQVVKLPGVFIKGLCVLQISSDKAAWVSQFSLPPVVINRSRAKDVVIMR